MDEDEKTLTQRKLALVLGSYATDNMAAYCQEKGIDRSYLYQLRRELEQNATEAWDAKKVGRPRKEREEPTARERELEQRYQELEKEHQSVVIQNTLANLLMDLYEKAGLFEDKRLKKKLPPQVRKWLSQRRSEESP